MSDRIFDNLLINTCDIYRKSKTATPRDALGGKSPETLSLVDSNVPCNIQYRKEYNQNSSMGRHEMGKYIGYFNSDTDIQEDDIIVFNSKKYLVRGAPDAAGQGHHFEAYLTRMDK